MFLLDLIARRDAVAAPAATRRNRTKSRPTLESLEGRQVLSTMKPTVMPVAPKGLGSAKPAIVAPINTPSRNTVTTPKNNTVSTNPVRANVPATPAPTATPTTPRRGTVTTLTLPATQTGTAFNMQWKCYYNPVRGQYNLNIQNAPGGLQVSVSRTKEAVFFTTKTWNGTQVVTNTVRGPSLPQNATVNIRNFATAGDNVLTRTTGLYWTMSTLPRVDVSYVNTPTGSIQLTYTYNSINNSGVLTVNNIPGSGRIVYSKTRLSPSVNDGPALDSPTANPISSIDFVLQNNSSYNGGIGVFHSGEADPTISVVVTNNNRAGYYSIEQGSW